MAKRITTSFIALAFAFLNLAFYDTLLLPISIGVISVIMIFEILKMVGYGDIKPLRAVCLVYTIFQPFAKYALHFQIEDNLIYPFQKMNMLFNIVIVIAFALVYIVKHNDLTFDKLAVVIVALVFIPYSMNVLLDITYSDPNLGVFYLIITLCGAWIADSGAFFVGTFLGKHKLCPSISPKKTVEGLLGGVAVNAIVITLVAYVYGTFIASPAIEFNYILIALIGASLALVGVVGDLFASLIKRNFGIKDFGTIMPGHGGAMDRFDSVLFVAPFMYIVLQLVNIIN